MTPVPDVRVTQLTSLDDLHSLTSTWTAWQGSPNADLEQFRLICRLRPEVVSPLVLTVERRGELCALLVARIEKTAVYPTVGYFRLIGVPARLISVIHGGILGQVDDEVASALLSHLRILLVQGSADMVSLHLVPESSAVHAAVALQSPRWWWEPEVGWAMHRSMSIGTGPDVLFKLVRSKHRSALRARLRALEGGAPGRVRWTWIDRCDDVPGLARQIESVALLTYQRGLGAGFIDDEETRHRLSIFSKRSELRVQLLEVDGQVRAFWLGSVLGETFHSWATGYSPEVAEFDAGTLTLAMVLDNLAAEGIRTFDFGLGDAHYKSRFADRSWREATQRIFAPTLKGTTLRLMLGSFALVDRGARRVLDSMRAADKLKTAWRRRVRATEPPR